MSKTKVSIGDVFGRLTVRGLHGKNRWGQYLWDCVCSCGNETVTMSAYLTRGETISCGCAKCEGHPRHGLTRTPVWESWRGMLDRCTNPKHANFPSYGGRGIKVCDRWATFENFLDDMGERPEGMSLDRIDVNGDYCPENCRWADRVTQARNTRTNRLITYGGITKTLTEWAEDLQINVSTLIYRLRHWTLERALTEAKHG